MANPELPSITITPFAPADQAEVKALILAGLAEHWGVLDPSLNPDLDDIAASYRQATFLVARCGDRIVGTGALLPHSASVAAPRSSGWRRSCACPLRPIYGAGASVR